jgi:hypothetical protein
MPLQFMPHERPHARKTSLSPSQVPGNALAVQADKPFRALQRYGMAFLNKFEASVCPAPILEKISFVDTPGSLFGQHCFETVSIL